MKEKNLPKLKKELMKLFGSSLSISSNIPISSNQIKPTETDAVGESNSTNFKNEKPEDVNITISLPQEKKQRNYKKTVKSIQNGKTYNIDIKKNETPLRLYFNNTDTETVTPDLLKPVNFVNYNIYRNTNTDINSPKFLENKIIQKSDTKNIENKKTEYIKEYVKIFNNFKKNQTNQNILENNSSNNILNTMFVRPYTFLTNSENIVFSNNIMPENKNIVFSNNTTSNLNTQNVSVNNTNTNSHFDSNLENVKFFENTKTVNIENNKTSSNKNLTVRNVIENRVFKNVVNKTNITNLPSTIPAFEKGGIVNKPTVALIGEKEPEIIIPKSKLPSIISNDTPNGALQKTNMTSKINEFMKTANTSIFPALKSIEANTKVKENLEQENIISKMSASVPKHNKVISNTLIKSIDHQETPALKIKRVSTTKGTNQFVPETKQMPSWRSHKV